MLEQQIESHVESKVKAKSNMLIRVLQVHYMDHREKPHTLLLNTDRIVTVARMSVDPPTVTIRLDDNSHLEVLGTIDSLHDLINRI